MEINSLFGLPAHPLVVHAAVVLLPLAAIATILTAAIPALAPRTTRPWRSGWRSSATIAVGLAQGSGESLKERVDETELVEEHAEQGETVLPWAIALTIVAAGVDRGSATSPVATRTSHRPA